MYDIDIDDIDEQVVDGIIRRLRQMDFSTDGPQAGDVAYLEIICPLDDPSAVDLRLVLDGVVASPGSMRPLRQIAERVGDRGTVVRCQRCHGPLAVFRRGADVEFHQMIRCPSCGQRRYVVIRKADP